MTKLERFNSALLALVGDTIGLAASLLGCAGLIYASMYFWLADEQLSAVTKILSAAWRFVAFAFMTWVGVRLLKWAHWHLIQAVSGRKDRTDDAVA